MESLLTEIIAQTPITGAFIVCVWIFLRYIKSRDEQHMSSLKQVADECHRIQTYSIDAVGKNTEVLLEMKGTMLGIDQTMRDVQTTMRTINGQR